MPLGVIANFRYLDLGHRRHHRTHGFVIAGWKREIEGSPAAREVRIVGGIARNPGLPTGQELTDLTDIALRPVRCAPASPRALHVRCPDIPQARQTDPKTEVCGQQVAIRKMGIEPADRGVDFATERQKFAAGYGQILGERLTSPG